MKIQNIAIKLNSVQQPSNMLAIIIEQIQACIIACIPL